MKSVLMSISPYWYYLIGENIKTIEVRKTIPKANDWNGIVECYMTKDKKSFARIPKEFQAKYAPHMGKVGMKFVCDKVDVLFNDNGNPKNYMTEILPEILKKTGLSYDEFARYVGNRGDGFDIYGCHISDLKIYGRPKELEEFFRPCPFPNGDNYSGDCHRCDFLADNDYSGVCTYVITRPPQSWMYVEEV